MRRWKGRWIIIGILAIIDIYIFSVVKSVTHNSSDVLRITIYAAYWLVSGSALLTVVLLPYVRSFRTNIIFRNYVFALLIGFFFAKIVASVFFALDDLRRGGVWVISQVFHGNGAGLIGADGKISRSAVLSWLGIGLGGGLYGTLLYGFSNKYNYQVKHIKLAYNNLPHAFKGLKIVQISDIHSGSLQNKEAVSKGVDMILEEKPDLILFTGDLVNDRVEEMEDYLDIFSRLHAPLGVYSTLGNHDYGDYFPWPDDDEKHKDAERASGGHLFTPMQLESIERLKQTHAKMGWRLLMNEHVVLEKGGQEIALLGIENWGAKGHFPKYGKMSEAYAGTEKYAFKILMSHDPSHWHEEVKPKYPGIDLTLSGHTHGMQFGVELPFFKWSPVQWMYKEWAGLYESGQQKLYVNRGFGFIGYPGRVGMLPEITVIELV
ncbi:MAG TPA: metallophosphoesterase [Chitinophagaceae bacterium]|nr:metallophosphoesterase [Chitinophagaceae bacterium]